MKAEDIEIHQASASEAQSVIEMVSQLLVELGGLRRLIAQPPLSFVGACWLLGVMRHFLLRMRKARRWA